MNATNATVLDTSRVSDRREVQPVPVKAPVSTDLTPAQMLALVVQQGADLAKIEKFMDLRDRWEAAEARKAFDAAISAAKAEIKPIVKNREVDFTSTRGRTNYDYEDFAAIAEHIDPILARHGLSYRHRAQQSGNALTITCRVSHKDGHFEEVSLTAFNDESGNKNGIQAIASAATYLQRYTVKIAFGLAAARDDDGNSVREKKSEFISADQVAALDKLITDTKANKGRLLTFLKLTKLEEIPAGNFDVVVEEIKRVGRAALERATKKATPEAPPAQPT